VRISPLAIQLPPVAADGTTVGLIGSGIGPSLSPALHEREARELGVAYRYELLDLDELKVPPEAVGDLLRKARDLGYRGLNITHPCKQLVLPHLDQLSPDAVAVGAVNTVVFDEQGTTGHNTDWTGFRDGLLSGLPGATRERVVLLGAGGAGAAAAYALLTIGTATVHVVDVDAARATRLAAALTAQFGADRAEGAGPAELADRLATADGLVHATPVGMAEHPGLPLPAALLRPDLWVAEIVYRPLNTALLVAARSTGCAVVDGGRMLVHQAATGMSLFLGHRSDGVEPDTGRMLRHLAELIGAETTESPDHVR